MAKEKTEPKVTEGTKETQGATDGENAARQSLLPGAAKEEPKAKDAVKPEPPAAVDYPVVECAFCLSRDTTVIPNAGTKSENGFRRRKCGSCRREFKEALARETAVTSKAG